MEINTATHNLYELSPKLDILKNCDMQLSAPIQEGIVQVGIDEPEHFAKLDVQKHEDGLYIARADDSPLQVEVNQWPDLDSGKIQVFTEPAEGILLVKAKAGRQGRIWGVECGDATIQSSVALYKFTEIICKFALMRQAQQKFAPYVGALSTNNGQNK